jgi:beta-lactamase regulating signal transducer with metallopeptidase domain
MTISEVLLALSGSPELSIVAKATVVLALGLAAARLATRARASVRHLVLGATFTAVVALPLAVKIAPRTGIDVPAPKAVRTPTPVYEASSGMMSTPILAGSRGWKAPSWISIARVVWSAGLMLQMVFVGFHLLRLRRICRTAVPWLDGRTLIQALAVECGVRRRVDVLVHEGLAAPITWGVSRPVIVMPIEASAWSEGDLCRALIHELEHVRRRDWWTQLAARAAVASYWFHPLAWAAWRQLCLEAERACDDAVLCDAESTVYAEQLVGLARRMSKAHARPALGMAHRSDLSRRVSAVLDSTRQRGRAGFLSAAGVIAASCLVLVAIAPLAAVAQSAGQDASRSRFASALDRALYEAAEDGDLKEIDSLLNSGANVNAAIRGDGSPLIGAARKGALAAVSRLLDRGADPNMPVSGDGNPLIMAAANGHVEVVSLLLDRGARIDEVVPSDENALIQASGNGHLNAVKLLVSRGANVNVALWVQMSGLKPSGEWRSPLIMARRGGHQAVIDFLVASGARE